MEELIKQYRGLLLIMIVYWCLCLALFFKQLNFLYVMLAWNVLLAVFPLFFIKKTEQTLERGKIGWAAFWLILWLLFFPNSVYLITDFIHISNDTFMRVIEGEPYSPIEIEYSNDIMVWVKLLVIGFGFLFAMIVGLESLYNFEKMIREKVSKLMCYLSIIVVALLTGIGVYIGRFLRFNSWDVLINPVHLFKKIAMADGFAGQFIPAFALFVIGGYTLYRAIRRETQE